MKTLSSLHDAHMSGHLDKKKYIYKMFRHHLVLREYATYLRNTDIAKIEIEDDSFIMTSRTSHIKIVCNAVDERIIPFEILNFGNYEKSELNMLMRMMKKNFVVFDIGANIGWYSLNIASFFPNSIVYAFEPIPQTYSLLKRNIDLNAIRNIRAYNIGFSNDDKKTFMYYYPEGLGNASLTNLTHRKSVKQTACTMEKIDSFIKKHHVSIDMIKCDVEGAELFVFQGGIHALQGNMPIVCTEMLRKWSFKFKYDPNKIIALFSKIGYQCFTVHSKYLKRFTVMDAKTTETNFFFLHMEKHKHIIHKLTP